VLSRRGTVSGGIFERNHASSWLGPRGATLGRPATQLHDQQAAKQTDEGLLADVDTDVSREVPSALEPLAQMMNDDETK